MSDDNDTPVTQPYETTPPSEAVAQGQSDAVANTKAERKASTNRGVPLEDTLADAQDTARANHKVDVANQPEANQNELKNDTSKKAKVDTTKAQLDPTGDDPISKAEIERAATDGVNVKGGTSVSNEEAAQRALDGNNDGEESTPVTEDAAGNPTLGHGETNVPADGDALHPGGGDADGSANSGDSSADKS